MKTLQNIVQRLNGFSLKHLFLGGLLVGGGYVLWEQYREQVIAYSPYLLFLLCPLMHIFMHKGHGGHQHGKTEKEQ